AVNVNPNLNTAHLKSAFFPASAVKKSDYAWTFDRTCSTTGVGCHSVSPSSHIGLEHPNYSVSPYDNVLTFGRAHANTPPDPKAYNWYLPIANAADYATRFSEAPAVWLVQDLTTNANSGSYTDNGTSYGTCVTCHDPHGSAAPTNFPGATTNYMLRGDAYNATGQFCNTVCHGN
ncbi:MAG TPA: hypothetical protein VGP72_06740, partial [Planctomycetota bacterium]